MRPEHKAAGSVHARACLASPPHLQHLAVCSWPCISSSPRDVDAVASASLAPGGISAQCAGGQCARGRMCAVMPAGVSLASAQQPWTQPLGAAPNRTASAPGGSGHAPCTGRLAGPPLGASAAGRPCGLLLAGAPLLPPAPAELHGPRGRDPRHPAGADPEASRDSLKHGVLACRCVEECKRLASCDFACVALAAPPGGRPSPLAATGP